MKIFPLYGKWVWKVTIVVFAIVVSKFGSKTPIRINFFSAYLNRFIHKINAIPDGNAIQKNNPQSICLD
jgi:hypothetical protein